MAVTEQVENDQRLPGLGREGKLRIAVITKLSASLQPTRESWRALKLQVQNKILCQCIELSVIHLKWVNVDVEIYKSI